MRNIKGINSTLANIKFDITEVTYMQKIKTFLENKGKSTTPTNTVYDIYGQVSQKLCRKQSEPSHCFN